MKKLLGICLAAGLVLGCAQPVNKDKTVWLTPSGEKYHRSSCRYVGSGATPVTLEYALAHGYSRCLVCKP